MRLILGCDRKTHIADMLNKLHWLNVRQRLYLIKCTFMYKIVHNLSPVYLSHLSASLPHSHVTRSHTNCNIFRSHCHHNSLQSNGVQLWNSLPNQIKQQPTVKSFKKSCLKYILGNLNIKT